MKSYAVYEVSLRSNHWVASFDNKQDAESYVFQELIKSHRHVLVSFDASPSFRIVEEEEDESFCGFN